MPNIYVYGKLRVCVRGFSEGKSDLANMQALKIPRATLLIIFECSGMAPLVFFKCVATYKYTDRPTSF
ncbi:hypothetical protein [Mariniflexile sp.]|uniref:hypothetical protein n=1 Tax=Mariniflexile sp. TaxID=1979402 RepID=UPI004047E0A9